MFEEAVAKKHSTTMEAIGIGNDMSAHLTLLTHFSQRYPKIPVFDDSFTSRTAIAFDFMLVSFARLHEAPNVLGAIRAIFETRFAAESEAGDELSDVTAAI